VFSGIKMERPVKAPPPPQGGEDVQPKPAPKQDLRKQDKGQK